MTDINQEFQRALKFQREGKLQEAESISIYINIHNSDSNHFLDTLNT